MEKCPSCRARFKGELECYRCGFDYQFALRCEREGIDNYNEAIRSLKRNDAQKALHLVDKSCFYDRTPGSIKLKALILLMKYYNGEKEEEKGRQADQSP
ncbi:MAG: hypothetical protein GY866_20570 [Proteobacteria bacterium]|nr:hypothetical protein [Pseudomonadota bacterium]